MVLSSDRFGSFFPFGDCRSHVRRQSCSLTAVVNTLPGLTQLGSAGSQQGRVLFTSRVLTLFLYFKVGVCVFEAVHSSPDSSR